MNMTNEQIQALLLIATAAQAAPEEWYPVGSYGDVVSIDDPKWSAVAEFVKTFNAQTVREILAAWEADKALIAEQAKRITELQSENEYIRKRFKETDLMFGKNILVMQAAIIEWQGTGDAKNGLAWIYNTLFGPGELPDEAEKDAQAYFDRKYAPLDEELMALHQWFWAQSEAERAAAEITLVVGGEDAPQ